jgi:hypothetical protein
MRSWVFGLIVVLTGCGGSGGAGAAGGSGGAAGAAGAIGAGGASSGGAAGALAATGGAAGLAGTGGAAGLAGTGGAGAGQPGGGIGGMNCRPDVLIVQDRSGSMNNDDNDQACSRGCSLGSKWTHVVTAVTDVVMATDASVNWGLKYFPDNTVCAASNPPVVPIAAGTGTAVASSLAATLPTGNTPTRDAVSTGVTYLQSLGDTNPKFLLLVTDGLPSCPPGCATMTASTSICTMTDNPTEDAAVEAAVSAAAGQGIHTFVIGVGALATAQNTLNQLAIAGGEAQTGVLTSYYAATDEAALKAALTSIVGTITGCPRP